MAKIQETIANEVSKLSLPKTQTQMPALSYASIARSGKSEQQLVKTKVILVYPKDANKEQTSEETKIDLQTKIKPKQIKLQVNRISKIRNGGIAIEVPTDQSEELDNALKKDFKTRTPKTNQPKFKIFGVPANLDKDQFMYSSTISQTKYPLKISNPNSFRYSKLGQEKRPSLNG